MWVRKAFLLFLRYLGRNNFIALSTKVNLYYRGSITIGCQFITAPVRPATGYQLTSRAPSNLQRRPTQTSHQNEDTAAPAVRVCELRAERVSGHRRRTRGPTWTPVTWTNGLGRFQCEAGVGSSWLASKKDRHVWEVGRRW